jgi:hypothetical protein
MPTVELDLVAPGGDGNRLVGKLTRDFLELLPGGSDVPLLRHVGGHLHPNGDVEVRSAHPDAVLGRFQQDIREDREGGFGRNAGRDGRQTLVQVLPSDREVHQASTRAGAAMGGFHNECIFMICIGE